MVSEGSQRGSRSSGRPNYKEADDGSSSSGGEGSDEDFEAAAPPARAAATPKSAKKAKSGGASPPSADAPADADRSVDGDSSDSDEEELRPRGGRRVKKVNPKLQQPKKAKTPVAKRTRAPKLPRVPLFEEEEVTEADEMLDIIRKKPNSMAMAVERWWKHFVDPATTVSAVHELVKLIVEAAGHKNEARGLPPSHFSDDDDVDLDQVISDLCSACAGSGQFEKQEHIGTKSLAGKKLRTNLEEFFLKLVLLAPRSELVDFDSKKFITWICALSNCGLSEFRNVATLAGMQILTGLCTVASEMGTEIANKSRQKQAESSSNKTNKAKETRLAEELEELSSTKRMLHNEIGALFNSVSVLRHSDSSTDIRARAVTYLGRAIQAHGEEMMENQYLKYLAWALHDKAKEVRCAALDELFDIYDEQNETWDLKLEQLTCRFKERFLDMRADPEKEVAVKGIKLCTMLFKNGVLEPEDEGWTGLYDYLNCEEDEVRDAAAGFVEEFYLKKQLQELFDSDSSASVSREEFKLKGMIELLNRVNEDSEVKDFAPLVRSFLAIEEDFGIQDWSLMCNLLLQEEGDENLDSEQKETLLSMLTASVASCLEADEKPKRGKKRKDTRANATVAIVSFLPKMLTTIGTEVSKMTLLMRLVRELDLSAITNSHKKDMDKIVAEVCDTIVKGQDASLLSAAASVLEALSDEEYPLKRMVEPAVVMLTEKLFIKLEEAQTSYLKTGKLNLTQALWIQRLSIVNNCIDVCSQELQPQVWEAVLGMLSHSVENVDSRLPVDTACLMCHLCVQTVAWRVQEAIDAPVSGSTKVGELEMAIRGRDEALVLLQKICNDDEQPWAVRLQAMTSVGDMMQLFGERLKEFLVGDGAEEEEVLMGDLIATKGMCACEGMLQDMAVMPKLPKPEVWKGSMLVNMDGYVEDDQDRWNLGKTIAFCNLKPLLFCLDDKDDSTTTSSLMASLVLQGNYNDQYRRKIAGLFRTWLTNTTEVETETLRWLQTHQMVYMHMMKAVKRNPKLDIGKLSYNMVESVNSLEDRGNLIQDYVTNAVDWVLSDVRNCSFFDAISTLIPRIQEDTARELVASLDNYVDMHQSDMEEVQEGSIANFKDRLLEQVESMSDIASQSSSGKSPSLKRKKKLRTKIDSDLESSEGMRTPVKASPRKRLTLGSSAKRKRFVSSDDEDEEGFVSAQNPDVATKRRAVHRYIEHSDGGESEGSTVY